MLTFFEAGAGAGAVVGAGEGEGAVLQATDAFSSEVIVAPAVSK